VIVSYAAIPISDCNPGIELRIVGSGIEKFVVPGLGLQIGRHFGIPN